MLSREVKKVLTEESPAFWRFDAVTEEIHDWFSHEKEDEAVILTCRGCSIKIGYDGTLDSFLRHAEEYDRSFDLEKYAGELEKEKGIAHDTALGTAAGIRDLFHWMLNHLAGSAAAREQKYEDRNRFRRPKYLCVEETGEGKARLVLLNEKRKDSFFVMGYVPVKGDFPTNDELEAVFGNLDGRTVDEAMMLLEAFADMTANTCRETPYYRDSWREQLRMEELDREEILWAFLDKEAEKEVLQEMTHTEEWRKRVKEGIETRNKAGFFEWRDAELERRKKEKLKNKSVRAWVDDDGTDDYFYEPEENSDYWDDCCNWLD